MLMKKKADGLNEYRDEYNKVILDKAMKTREVKHDIKVLDKAAEAAKSMKQATIRTKDQIQNLMDDGQISPEEYAEDKMRYHPEVCRLCEWCAVV